MHKEYLNIDAVVVYTLCFRSENNNKKIEGNNPFMKIFIPIKFITTIMKLMMVSLYIVAIDINFVAMLMRMQKKNNPFQ